MSGKNIASNLVLFGAKNPKCFGFKETLSIYLFIIIIYFFFFLLLLNIGTYGF